MVSVITESLTSLTPGRRSTAPRIVAAQLAQSMPPTVQLRVFGLASEVMVMNLSA